MANRSNLVAHYSSRALPPNDPSALQLLTANYQIPVLWLSLFAAQDLTSCTAEAMNGEGTVSAVVVPTLHAPRSTAVERSQSRESILRVALPSRVHSHVSEWYALLPSIREPYLQLDAFEIWCMEAPEVFTASLSGYLCAMDDSDDPAWHELLDQACIGDAAVERWGVRGYAWSIQAPWGSE